MLRGKEALNKYALVVASRPDGCSREFDMRRCGAVCVCVCLTVCAVTFNENTGHSTSAALSRHVDRRESSNECVLPRAWSRSTRRPPTGAQIRSVPLTPKTGRAARGQPNRISNAQSSRAQSSELAEVGAEDECEDRHADVHAVLHLLKVARARIVVEVGRDLVDSRKRVEHHRVAARQAAAEARGPTMREAPGAGAT